jgi:D-alanyl-D-alanine carboxypeptidase
VNRADSPQDGARFDPQMTTHKLEKTVNAKYTPASALVLVFLLSILAGCAITPPKLPPTTDIRTPKDLDSYLDKLVDMGEPPGVSVVVVKGEDIVYQKSFGKADDPRDILASNKSVYQWWSLTKIFTSVAILQLAEAGQLNITDPVDKHLDIFDVDYREGSSSPVNIQHLLSHSSGLEDIGIEILGWIHYDGDVPLAQTELLRLTLPEHKVLAYEPGTEGRYSNLGYMVLAAVIEKVSGQSYASYIVENILQPLNMSQSGFAYSKEMEGNGAVGSHPADLMSIVAFHYIDKSRAIREKSGGRYWFNHVYSDQQGSTGLIGSTGDLARFMVALLNGGTGSSAQILSPESIRLMALPYVPVAKAPGGVSGEFKFGLGWFYLAVDNRISLSHGGAGAAFVDMMRIYPDESLGIAIMANSTYLGRSMGAEIIDAIADMNWDG